MTKKNKSAYAQAGVDIDKMMSSLKKIGKKIKSTNTKEVVSELGSFGGLFKSPGIDHLLVSSIDGVGTKLKIANMANIHNTVGQDLVNHCVNDILVQGARPLFFMDYLGAASLEPKVFEDVLSGFCKACKENKLALLGGETAEMPGLYPRGEYDLVGAVIGSVPRKKVITGKKIKNKDIIIGLPSSGLHTNGYSLARKIIFDKCKNKLNDIIPGTKTTFKKYLLAVHKSYLNSVSNLLKKVDVHGMAHITGGGLLDNIPRILPNNLNAVVNTSSWKPHKIYSYIQDNGKININEMYRVFNMGIGYILIISPNDLDKTIKILDNNNQKSKIIGIIDKGNKKTILTN